MVYAGADVPPNLPFDGRIELRWQFAVGSLARWYERNVYLLPLLGVAAFLDLRKPDLHETRRLVVG